MKVDPPPATRELGQPPGVRRAVQATSTAKGFFFAAAFLSFLLSVSLFFSGDRERGIFVGIWVPSILSAGALLFARGPRHD